MDFIHACTPRADGPDRPPASAAASPPAFAGFDAVVIAASLGGPASLAQVLERLPEDFPAPVLVAQHLHVRSPSYWPTILGHHARVVVKQPEPGEQLSPGVVYLARPGWHLLVAPGLRCAYSDAPRVSHARPAADVLFTSAAEVLGARALAVVLTGRLRDGANGAAAIRRAGGVVLVQDPATCRAPGMPRAAIERGAVHFTLPPEALGAALVTLVAVPGGRALFGLGPRRTAVA